MDETTLLEAQEQTRIIEALNRSARVRMGYVKDLTPFANGDQCHPMFGMRACQDLVREHKQQADLDLELAMKLSDVDIFTRERE